MKSNRNRIKSFLLAVPMMAAMASPVWAVDPVTDVTADVLFARPIGLVVTIAGAGAFIATAPFTYVAGTHQASAEQLVKAPYRYTFERPLGKNL